MTFRDLENLSRILQVFACIYLQIQTSIFYTFIHSSFHSRQITLNPGLIVTVWFWGFCDYFL